MNDLYKSVPVKSSEITPYSQYLSRRDFLKAAGIVTGSALLAACAPSITETAIPADEAPVIPSGKEDELGDPANSYEDITNYNNYYEFTTDKENVAKLAQDFNPSPWTVEVYGLVNKPRTFGMKICSASSRRRNASIACVVWRRGAWSSRGRGSHWQVC